MRPCKAACCNETSQVRMHLCHHNPPPPLLHTHPNTHVHMYTVYFVRALSGPLDHPPLCNSVHTQYLSVTACPALAPPHFSLTPPRPVVMSWPWACKQKRVKKWTNTSRHRRQGNPPIVDQQKWPARRTKSEPPPPHLHSPSTPLNLPPPTLHSPSTPPPLSLHPTSHHPPPPFPPYHHSQTEQ